MAKRSGFVMHNIYYYYYWYRADQAFVIRQFRDHAFNQRNVALDIGIRKTCWHSVT